jgi:phosphoglycolate phosphatase
VTNESKSLVLFDIDGTLMRGAGPHHKQALIDGVRKITGLLTTLDDVDTSGRLDRDLILSMLRAAGESERSARAQLRAIMRECQDCYLATCVSDLTPFLCRGVLDALQELKVRGAVMGLVTGNLSSIGRKKVELAGLDSFFSVGAFAEDGRTRARLAQVAAWRARRAGFSLKDARISLIGDHANDVEAARANGFQSVAVASGVLSFDELAVTKPDILVHHLGELELSKLL